MTEERKTRIPPTHTAAQIWSLLKANGTAYTMESLHATLGELMRTSYEPSEEDVEAFYMRVTASGRSTQRSREQIWHQDIRGHPCHAAISDRERSARVLGRSQEGPVSYRRSGNRPRGHPAQAESLRTQQQGKGRRSIQAQGADSPHRGTPGAAGRQDRPCTEGCQPKETQRPAVPSLPEGHTPRQSVLLSHSSRVPALQPRSSPTNPRLDARRGGERETPAIQLDLHSPGVRRRRTNISPCKPCTRYTCRPPRPCLLSIHADTEKAPNHSTTLMVRRLRSHSTHVQRQGTIQDHTHQHGPLDTFKVQPKT